MEIRKLKVYEVKCIRTFISDILIDIIACKFVRLLRIGIYISRAVFSILRRSLDDVLINNFRVVQGHYN